MWKNSLKNIEYGNNKILYETLLDFFFYRESESNGVTLAVTASRNKSITA